MTGPQKKVTSFLLLAAYLSCFVLAELVHGHHPARAIPDGECIASHTCGDIELHRPLDGLSQCALCRDGHGRTLAIVHVSPEDGLSVNPLDVPFPSDENPTIDTCPSGGITRGPPAI